jgi:hypothetical protein
MLTECTRSDICLEGRGEIETAPRGPDNLARGDAPSMYLEIVNNERILECHSGVSWATGFLRWPEGADTRSDPVLL